MKKTFILMTIFVLLLNWLVPIEQTYGSQFSKNESGEILEIDNTPLYGEIPLNSENEEASFWGVLGSFAILLVVGIAMDAALYSPGFLDPFDVPSTTDDSNSLPLPSQSLSECYNNYGWDSFESIESYVQWYFSSFTSCNGDDICEDICDYFTGKACSGEYSVDLMECLFTTGHPEWGCEGYLNSEGTLICP